MSRWLIQCLTVVTMLASLLHGQCLLSCSLQSPPHASVVPPAESGAHPCCPHSDDQKSQNSEKPCQPDSAAINPASSDAQLTTSMVLPIVLLDQPGGLLPPLNLPTRLAPDL